MESTTIEKIVEVDKHIGILAINFVIIFIGLVLKSECLFKDAPLVD